MSKQAAAKNPAPAARTPEQLAEHARINALLDAQEVAGRELMERALRLATRLAPGRTASSYGDAFAVMFGDPTNRGCSMAGPGLVELRVEVAPISRNGRSTAEMATDAPTLRLMPRAYSLGSDATLEHCEAQGLALMEAARFGRTLLALVSA